jgi:hypothetical protein
MAKALGPTAARGPDSRQGPTAARGPRAKPCSTETPSMPRGPSRARLRGWGWGWTWGLVLLSLSSAAAVVAPNSVPLGSAEPFGLFAKMYVSGTASTITGLGGANVGARDYVTLLPWVDDASGEFTTSDQVDGLIYASKHVGSTPALLTNANADIDAAYVDAAARPVSTPSATYSNAAGGVLSGYSFLPGVYWWAAHVSIMADNFLVGSEMDLFIFQVRARRERLTEAEASRPDP